MIMNRDQVIIRTSVIGILANVFLAAFKAAVGSFLGFIMGTGLKTIVAVLIMWKILVFAF